MVEHKITVSNLKRLIFGKGAKTTQKQSPTIEKPEVITESEKSETPNQASQEDKKFKGHGRLPRTAYTHANEHTIPHESLCPGESCPLACGGKLYRITPGVLVNIKGQNLASVNKYWIEKLRCALCNEVFSATIPKQVCKEKYHPSFKAMLALQKYYMAMPFHRQDYFQSLLGFPIAASTQWQLIEELASCALLVFPTLEKMAANGSLIHNDDTVVRIVDVIHNEQRRLLYHQRHSQPSMLKAKAYMEDLFSSKQIEPNESLGKAINYMLKHWDKLTRFLSVSGAPIDNNNVERGLKIPIRGRNSWLFYKTEYGAMVGGVLTSIIYTCELAGINPFEYLVVLQEYKDHIIKEPKAWLPWSYKATKALLESSIAA